MNLAFKEPLETVLNTVLSRPGIMMQHEWELRMFIRMVLDDLKPKRTVELGSWKGFTGSILSHATTIKTVSIDNAEYGRWEDEALNLGSNLVFLVDDCRTTHAVDEAMKHLGGQVDLLFIDDGHSYDDIKTEVELWKQVMNPSGWIAFHDINPLANLEANGGHSPVCQSHRSWNDLVGNKTEIIATDEHKQWRGTIPHGGIGILKL